MEWKMSRATIILVSVFCLFGCATTSELGPVSSQTIRQVGTKPVIGISSTANVGQKIFEEYNYTATKEADYYRVEKPINLSVAPMMNVNVTPSTVLYKATEQKYCIDNYGNDCLYDQDSDGMFELASSKPGMIEFKKELPERVKYEPAAGAITIMNAGGYSYQLIYQGRDENTLRLRYMEFTDNLARPAFSQDLTYPIKAGNKSEVIFKNVKIDVSKVSDASIDYVVLNGSF